MEAAKKDIYRVVAHASGLVVWSGNNLMSAYAACKRAAKQGQAHGDWPSYAAPRIMRGDEVIARWSSSAQVVVKGGE